ncbi:MAG: hypothetical protein QOF14_2741 [Hyphomicrobiales bacterium]|jgi:hypothetical protein|nr:hypothetical protein [Hyphomicrobiales bacterium]
MVDIAEVHESRPGYLHALAVVCAGIVIEYRRAIAAEKHYVSLKHESDTALAHEGTARSDIPRRVFKEFYSNRAK